MRLILHRGPGPVEEIAAEPDTLALIAEVLARARRTPAGGGRVAGTTGLHALPLVPDASVPPLTVLLRPHPTRPA